MRLDRRLTHDEGIGDLVFVMPLLYALIDHWPGARIQLAASALQRAFAGSFTGGIVNVVPHHATDYREWPALLSAVFVYTWSLELFGIHASLGEILGYLPVIFFGAAVPGPMRAVAITMWTQLFPDHVGEAAAFGLCMHNFFIFFNAALGLFFMRRAQREIFGGDST